MIKCPQGPSSNKKLGAGVWASYREVGPTCPTTCAALKTKACYALYGHVRLLANKSAYGLSDGAEVRRWFAEDVGHRAMVRHHVSGDVCRPGGEVDWAYVVALCDAADSRPDVTSFGYTHAWELIDDPSLLQRPNMVFNASCDTYEEADRALAAGWPTVLIVAEDATTHLTPGGARVAICPQQLTEHEGPARKVTCKDCRLCANAERQCVVGFRLHGAGKKKMTVTREEE